MKKYSLTEEHLSQLKPWADRWINNARSVKPMDEVERELCRKSVLGLYAEANLPAPKNIVFVPSPFVLRFAGGFSAAVLWHRNATRDATYAATYAATDDATDDATDAATDAATRAATDAATRDATYAATDEDQSRWYTFRGNMTAVAVKTKAGELGLKCAIQAYRLWNGGNQWSAWASFLSFFRHVAKLPIDYTKWDHWETLAEHSGPRIMHAEFCMISDRPEVLKQDAQNRPHCENGPFCRWRDGSALYAIHGVRLPAWIVEHPEKISVDIIANEKNAEIRRIMIGRYKNGEADYIQDSGAEKKQEDDYGSLYVKKIPGDEAIAMVHVINSTPEPDGTFKPYWIRVPPTVKTAREAVAWSFGIDEKIYQPSIET